jgi:hypothetical protein
MPLAVARSYTCKRTTTTLRPQTDRYRRLVRRHPRWPTHSCLSHARTSCACPPSCPAHVPPAATNTCSLRPGSTPHSGLPPPASDRPHSPARSTCPVDLRASSALAIPAAARDLVPPSTISPPSPPPTSREQWVGWRVSACGRECVWPARTGGNRCV